MFDPAELAVDLFDWFFPIGPPQLLTVFLVAALFAFMKGRYLWASFPVLIVLGLATQINILYILGLSVFAGASFGTVVVAFRLARPGSLWARFFYVTDSQLTFEYQESINRFNPERFERENLANTLPQGWAMSEKSKVVRADSLTATKSAKPKPPRKVGWTAFWTGEMFPDDNPDIEPPKKGPVLEGDESGPKPNVS